MQRKHLTATEVDKLLAAATGRNSERNKCLLMLAYRHGLRISEALGLRLDQIDIESSTIHVERLKHGLSTSHPLRPDEIRLIKSWLRVRASYDLENSQIFFLSERGTQIERSVVNRFLALVSKRAGLPLRAHPHMLRHGCGYALADQGADTRLIQDYLGHKSISHTVRYTAANPERFIKLWRA